MMTKDSEIFPELNHELIKPLQNIDDVELWKLWQKYPQQAKYLLMLFYRYFNLINNLITNVNKIDIEQKYYERLWFFIFDQLTNYSLEEDVNFTEVLQQITQNFFERENIIVKEISQNQDLSELRKLPLKYYLQKNIEKLSPLERLIVVSKDKFAWEDEQIFQYLEGQKKIITLAEIKAYYTQAHSKLVNLLPIDIVAIYL